MFDGLIEPGHLLLILLIALIVFGPKKLPELGRGLGKGIREFKDSMNGATDKVMKEVGVTPEDARKFNESLQSVRNATNLKSTITNAVGQKALEQAGLQSSATPAAKPAAGEAATPATGETAAPAAEPAKSETPTA